MYHLNQVISYNVLDDLDVRRCCISIDYSHAAEPHDMYYYTYPLEMMQGEISTPGCFLEAKDILRRHFLAYCIDTWTSSDVNNTLPEKIRELHLLNDNIFNDPTFVINRTN